jgi:exopolysaccharide biosynthesis protein
MISYRDAQRKTLTRSTMNYLSFHSAIVAVLVTNFTLVGSLSTIAQTKSQILPHPAIDPIVPSRSSLPNNSAQNFVSQGAEIFLNGRTINVPWGQWKVGKSLRVGISDTGLTQQLGVELFNNGNYTTQPIDWYATGRSRQVSLDAKLSRQYRYLDITDIARTSGWQWQLVGGKLQLDTPATKIINVDRQTIPKNGKIVITLDRYTPWKLSQTPTEGYLTIDAKANPTLLAGFNTPSVIVDENIDPDDDPTAQKLQYKVTSSGSQTVVQFPIVKGQRARGKMLSPTSLEVSINPNLETLPDRQINWAPGIKWNQKWVKLGNDNFAVTYLEVDPRQKGIKIRPTIAQENSLIGSNPLVKFAPSAQAAAAINGGYFNRNNRFPLGALKRDGKWLSSPILNRGAIGWNDFGQVRISRLQMNETLKTYTGEQLPLNTLNSGYVQTGIGRYTTEWGRTYTPIQSNELIVTVQNDKVTQITPGDAPDTIKAFIIPPNGYLLALRGQPELAQRLSIGTLLTLQRRTNPPELDTSANILAAGPWMVQGGKIVLDGKGENFGAAFVKEQAVRSAIGITPTGNMLIVTVHDRVGGKGPTLAEMAQLLQTMGVVDALNLDGGSSTSLYLGGQLINRSSATAAKVHNAIGIFIDTDPPSALIK